MYNPGADEDFANLIQVLALYFSEYGTSQLELSVMRAVAKIHEPPIQAFSFDKWAAILTEGEF